MCVSFSFISVPRSRRVTSSLPPKALPTLLIHVINNFVYSALEYRRMGLKFNKLASQIHPINRTILLLTYQEFYRSRGHSIR